MSLNKKYWLKNDDFYFENNGDLLVTLYNKNGSVLNEFSNIRPYKDFDEHIILSTKVMQDFVDGMPSKMRQELMELGSDLVNL